VHNLRKICDEIFGEGNVDALIWNKEAEGKSGTLKQTSRFRSIHEYIVICYKNKSIVYFDKISEPLKGRENEFQTANLAVNEQQQNDTHDNFYKIVSPNGIVWEKHWKVSCAEFENLNVDGLIYWGKQNDRQPRRVLPTDHRRMVYSTSIIEKGGTTIGRKNYEMIMPEETFSYPKPISIIKQIIAISKSKNDFILDFFSGSATTAHAVMQLNAEDKGERKYICVQIPEKTDEKSEAFKAGYKNICEIGKERIRRAGEKIKQDNADKEGIDDLDTGFRVLKIDSSNMKNVYFEPSNTHQEDMLDLASNIKENRTDEDLLFMVLLAWGIDLSTKIERKQIAGKTVYFVDNNYLAACFEQNINEYFVKKLVEQDANSSNLGVQKLLKVVFKNSSFADDSVKINVEQIFKQANIEIKVV
jgi:adenine-specific DNA-methyltransferase